MERVIRPVAAVLLALALGAVPLVADWCAATCEAGHATASAEPTCQHTASAVPRVGELPAPCNHDHHPVVVDAATIAAAAVRAAVTLAISATASSFVQPADAGITLRADRQATQPPPVALQLAAVLRV